MAKESDAPKAVPAEFTAQIAVALARRFGHTHAAIKTVATWTGANERTVKNWFAGRYAPSAHHLVTLAAKSDDVMEVFLSMTCRADLLAAVQLSAVRQEVLVAVDRLHDLLNRGK
jgi:hypothetical protein